MSSTLALALSITALNGASSVLNTVGNDTRKLSKYADEVKKKFNDAWIEVGKGAAAWQYGLSKMGGVVKPAADLEEAMLNVRANLGSNTKAAAELNAQLKEVANTSEIISNKTRISKVGATNIQNELLKGGLAQGDIGGEKGAAMSVATLATLSKMDEGTAAVNVVNLGSMFDLKKEQYGELADMLVRVDDAAATSIPKLVYGMQQAGFSAKALGESSKSTAIALAMLSPLGEMAGTSLNRMLENTTGKTKHSREAMLALGLATEKGGKFDNAFYDNGKFIGIAQSLELIRDKLKAVKGDGNRLLLAEKIFGEEGGRAAMAALLAGKGYKEIEAAMNDSYSAARKLEILMGGMNAQTDRFKNTWSSLLAEVFEPLSGTVTTILDKLSNSGAALTKLASQSDATKNAASIGAGVIGASMLAYIALKFSKGIGGALSGLVGTATGIAQGKAIEAATGVTPVFVTNFPAGLGGGSALPALAETGAAAAAGGALARIKDIGKAALLLGGMRVGAIAQGSAAALGTAGAMVGAAGLAGYGAGTLFNKTVFEGTESQRTMGGVIAQMMAYFGNQNAKEALEINLHLDGQQISTVVNARNMKESRRN
jgi:TP901 family phage tail tape measure protein